MTDDLARISVGTAAENRAAVAAVEAALTVSASS
jgi:histidinol-phosphate/aromatic aminotransferase/cobyric acid decarboxylase-like protein